LVATEKELKVLETASTWLAALVGSN